MPLVRCPSCNRALNLPEAADIVTAQCPLCATTFEVPSRAEPPLSRMPMPRASPVDVPPAPSPFRFDEESDDLPPRNDREAVRSASAWMRAAGVTGLGHLFFCACVSFAFINESEALVFAYCGSYVFQLVASLLVYNGASALQRRSSAGYVWTTAVLALALAALSLLLAAPVFLRAAESARRQNEDVFIVGIAGLLNLAVIVTFLVAGLKTILVMLRDPVRRGFDR